MKKILLSLLCTLCLISTIAWAQEIIEMPGDPAESLDWYKKSDQKNPTLATVSYFHEGHGCSQDWYSHTNGRDDRSVSPNDEFKSLDFRGPAGTVVTVYDARGFAQTDDFAVMIKTDNSPACVWNFEEETPGKWYTYRGYKIWYSGGNGLDGKVSSVRWGQWW